MSCQKSASPVVVTASCSHQAAYASFYMNHGDSTCPKLCQVLPLSQAVW